MKKRKTINLIVHTAIFGSLAIILYCVPYLQFNLPFAPSFLKIHLDEIPIFIAGYAYGPLTATLIIIIKGLFKLIQDIPETGGIGVLCDYLYSFAFILPACFIYKYNRNLKGLFISFGVGLLSQLLASCVIGLYTMYPLYGFYYFPQSKNYTESMANIGLLFSAFDKSITTASDPKVIYEFLLPFNLIKDGIVLITTFLVYKPLKLLIEQNKNPS